MKIKVADFDIQPVKCPANFLNCAPCKYASFTKVHNCSERTAVPDFGYIECCYIETVTSEIQMLNKKGIPT